MAETPTVRRYRPDDAERVERLYRRALSEAGTDPDDVPGTEDLRNVERAYLDPGGEFLVAEAERGDDTGEREIVAIGALAVDGETPAGTGELFRVAVDPDRQREGHGSAILDGLEAAARERGLDRIALTTARRQSAAVTFYEARGYERVGREREGEYELLRFEKRLK